MHHLYNFRGYPEPGSQPIEDWPCTVRKATDLLKAWYDSDKPFFTKKDLKSVSNQLNRRYNTRRQNNSQKQLITVKGLSGSNLSYEVLTGQVLTGKGYNQEWEIQRPKIRYLCYEQLTSSVESGRIGLEEAFFPLQIEHFMLKRASDTKLPVLSDCIENPVPVDEFLQSTLKSWKQSPEWVNLEALLKLVATHKITKVVGIASGSMEFGPDDEDCTMRSAVQHSLMISIKESIEEKTDQQIRCYAQDPRYTSADSRALAQYGCEVLEDPQALLEIDDDCVLFSCCPSLPVKEITADFARPAMLVWDSFDNDRGRRCHNPDSARVLNMIDNEYDYYEFWDMHEFEEAPFTSHLVAYIRRKVE
ncbi:hypothetical protein N7517_008062 [Penicillium concentricum]|uniref:SRR1-like domain-containing protein n=1 Tax=Penicillium concentricum TaxID=293559 RepID=A0A9W9RRR7_9EURO|nr:uncharacterized protein N7517_008062 [Penicillium concentricum]KAJ5365176.1 hypothetical protein N7517_008062 [Penicillium concentricum]